VKQPGLVGTTLKLRQFRADGSFSIDRKALFTTVGSALKSCDETLWELLEDTGAEYLVKDVRNLFEVLDRLRLHSDALSAEARKLFLSVYDSFRDSAFDDMTLIMHSGDSIGTRVTGVGGQRFHSANRFANVGSTWLRNFRHFRVSGFARLGYSPIAARLAERMSWITTADFALPGCDLRVDRRHSVQRSVSCDRPQHSPNRA
jgi:hypothetical protein